LVHAENDLARNFLVPEDLTMVLFDTSRKQIFGDLVRGPRLHFKPRVSAFFLLVCLFALDVRNAVVEV